MNVAMKEVIRQETNNKKKKHFSDELSVDKKWDQRGENKLKN